MESVRNKFRTQKLENLAESRCKEEQSKTGSFDSYLERRKEDCSK